MTAVLSILLPILIRSAEDGTLLEIVEAAVKLVQLVLPLITSPAVQAELKQAIVMLEAARPAQPEDPAMQHAAGDRPAGMGR